MDAARIQHPINAGDDEDEQGEYEVDHLAVSLARRTG